MYLEKRILLKRVRFLEFWEVALILQNKLERKKKKSKNGECDVKSNNCRELSYVPSSSWSVSWLREDTKRGEFTRRTELCNWLQQPSSRQALRVLMDLTE